MTQKFGDSELTDSPQQVFRGIGYTLLISLVRKTISQGVKTTPERKHETAAKLTPDLLMTPLKDAIQRKSSHHETLAPTHSHADFSQSTHFFYLPSYLKN